MKYQEENHAKELYKELKTGFSSSHPITEVKINGKGVHWDCQAKRGKRDCKIHCFGGPEYLVNFNQGSEILAIGRTSSKDDVQASVRDWLDNDTLENLHAQFDCIDQTKRRLTAIKLDLINTCPELEFRQNLSNEMKKSGL